MMAAFENADGLTVARELIPPKVRRGIYAAASLLGYALGAVVVGYASAVVVGYATPGDLPEYVPVALAVLGALMGPLGQLAATNTPSAPAVAVATGVDSALAPVDDDDYDPDIAGESDGDVPEDENIPHFGP
jgi:hypothetical protein